jgi:REP element-mobilizing transposase RayT
MAEQAEFSKLYHRVYALHYHLVMCTKYRKKCIDAAMLARVREIAATRCTGWGGSLLEFNGEADQVHLLVALPPDPDLSRFVNISKRRVPGCAARSSPTDSSGSIASPSGPARIVSSRVVGRRSRS